MEKKTTVPKSRQSLEPPIASAAALRAACAKNLQVRAICSLCWVCAICSNDDIMIYHDDIWIYIYMFGFVWGLCLKMGYHIFHGMNMLFSLNIDVDIMKSRGL